MRKVFWITFCIGICVAVLPSFAVADSVGQQVSFRVDSEFDFKQRNELFASLRVVTNQLYFYVEDEWWGMVSPKGREDFIQRAEQLASRFETEIYPTITATFGKENTPGVDNDPHITVLVHRMEDGIRGYFNTGDGYTKFEAPGSNEREMVYVSEQALADALAPSYLAHEFMHLVYFNQKQLASNTKDEIWIQEGFAELAPTLVGYDDAYEGSYVERRVRDFLSGPRDSLVEWRGLRSDYGVVHMFFQYVLDQYGVQVLVDALHNGQGGIASLEAGLQSRGIEKSFSEVFANWTITMFVNDCAYGREYCFERAGLSDIRVVPFTNFLSSVGETQLTVTNETKNWAGNWHKISGGRGELSIVFDGNPHAQFVVPYVVEHTNGAYDIAFFSLAPDQAGVVTVPDFGTENQAVIILPSVQHAKTGFDKENPSYFFSWTVSTDSKNGNMVSAEAQNPEPSINASSEVASLLQRIAVLQTQLASLRRQLSVATGTPANTNSAEFTCTFQQNLSRGAGQSNEVKCLQEFFKQHDSGVYPESLVTGNFLQLTHAAVIRFQEKYRVDILDPLGLDRGTGFVGPATREKIQELMASEQLVLTISAAGVY